MNHPLPDRMTLRPERAGLVYHEIIADGLFHAAAVGLPHDHTLAERVALVAWVNGAVLVAEDVPAAGRIAGLLRQSLDSGASETEQLCETAAAAAASAGAVDVVLRDLGRQACRLELDLTGPDAVRLVRQVVGSAVLGGIHSRAAQPGLFKSLCDFAAETHGDHRFLSTRLWDWTLYNDAPYAHPFLEYLGPIYVENQKEYALIREGCSDALPRAIKSGEPWRPAYWLQQGWERGTTLARFAPDLVLGAAADFTIPEAEANRATLRDFVRNRRGCDHTAGLLRAFDCFIANRNPFGLAEPEFRRVASMLLAARAYDYAFWMAAGSLLPRAFDLATD